MQLPTQKDYSTQISELLKKNNKHDLLDVYGINNSNDWNAAWERYIQEGKNKWNIPDEEGLLLGTAPTVFKETCRQKMREKVKSTNDPRYQDIINYCTKPKTSK